MSLPLPLEQALARGKILATNTTESTHVIRVGEWVYKFLKPPDQMSWQPPDTFLRQLRARVEVSRAWPEFNPLMLVEARWQVVSPFILGRAATIEECRDLYRVLRQSNRGYVQDVGPKNVRVMDGRPLVLDFSIAEFHSDWLFSKSLFASQQMETVPCP